MSHGFKAELTSRETEGANVWANHSMWFYSTHFIAGRTCLIPCCLTVATPTWILPLTCATNSAQQKKQRVKYYELLQPQTNARFPKQVSVTRTTYLQQLQQLRKLWHHGYEGLQHPADNPSCQTQHILNFVNSCCITSFCIPHASPSRRAAYRSEISYTQQAQTARRTGHYPPTT